MNKCVYRLLAGIGRNVMLFLFYFVLSSGNPLMEEPAVQNGSLPFFVPDMIPRHSILHDDHDNCFSRDGNGRLKRATTNDELYSLLKTLMPGDTLLLADGTFKDVQLIAERSGKTGDSICIMAENSGKVTFSGDVKVEIRGDYIVLKGITFKDGNRDITKWDSHGPGLVAIYGSHNRVTECAFDAFDEANSAYITTSVSEDGRIARYCRIDHCSFVNKITFDQVINLNNSTHPVKKTGKGGEPMYHRVDHNFFANPKKPGNAGGGIRVGYYRNDIGRCVIDSNLFMRQDSEPEIITSKSQENLYYGNTFLNCRGTLNLRHGDKQYALNNFFITSDEKFEYGGMFVWGSGHVIANNYFELQTTIKDRGNAAIYLNPGADDSEHALAFDILLANNIFNNINGYAIDFNPFPERRLEFAIRYGYAYQHVHDITLTNNVFYSGRDVRFPFFKDTLRGMTHGNVWDNNLMYGNALGIDKQEGMIIKRFKVFTKNGYTDKIKLPESYKRKEIKGVANIPGIALNIDSLINRGIHGHPLEWKDVGPSWMSELPAVYAKTGVLPSAIRKKFDSVIRRRTNK